MYYFSALTLSVWQKKLHPVCKKFFSATAIVVFFARGLRRDCQLLLFSATYDDQVMRFAESIVHDAIIIKLRREEQSLDNIKQYYIECTSLEDKFSALSNIYGSISIGQSMIFCHVNSVLLTSFHNGFFMRQS